MTTETQETGAEALAQRFHETYERLATAFGYRTRRESAKPWAAVPEQNRRLMTAVCAEILAERDAACAALTPPVVEDLEWAAGIGVSATWDGESMLDDEAKARVATGLRALAALAALARGRA